MTVNTGKLSFFFFFLLETQTAAAQGAAKMPSCSVGERIRRGESVPLGTCCNEALIFQ